MRAPSRLEYMFLIAIILCPSGLVAGWYLITEATAGNTIAMAILITCGVLLVGFFSNLSTLAAIFANQRQDNQVLQNSRQAQDDALQAIRMLAQMQRAETERQKHQQPAITISKPEPKYLDSGHDVIEGLIE